MKLRSRVRRMMMTRGLIAVTTCDQGRSYPGQDDDTERRPCDGQAGEQRREREESVWREICSRVPRLVSCVPAQGAQPDQLHWLLLPVTGGQRSSSHQAHINTQWLTLVRLG